MDKQVTISLELAKEILEMLQRCGYAGRNRQTEKRHERQLVAAIRKAQ